MEIIDKIVDFEFCKTCTHCDLEHFKDPCNECLSNTTNTHSKRPIFYEEDETRLKIEEKKKAEENEKEGE